MSHPVSGIKSLLDNLSKKHKDLEAQKEKLVSEFEVEKSKKEELLEKVAELQSRYDHTIDQQADVEEEYKVVKENLDECSKQGMSDGISTAADGHSMTILKKKRIN